MLVRDVLKTRVAARAWKRARNRLTANPIIRLTK